MDEPHQRVQSGKLRPSNRRSILNNENSFQQPIEPITVGITNASSIETDDSDDTVMCFMQTPTSLSDSQVKILTAIAKECGVTNKNAVDREWRNTWNIGTWCIGNQVSVSVNIMQPNIALCWANIVSTKIEDVLEVVNKYSSYELPKSKCKPTVNGNKCQIQGRWTLHAIDELISINAIKPELVEIGGLNICQSRVFIWVLVGSNSQYLCTLTEESVELLARYTPDWCLDIQEPTKAKNITLRARDPEKTNDSSTLSIGTSGWIQYNGRRDNASRLYGALTSAIRSVMESRNIKTFLENLHYDIVPQDF